LTELNRCPTDPAAKIMTIEQALEWRLAIRKQGKRLVVTNGCFDILHRGHAQYLHESRCVGDVQLVLINSDRSIKELKGPTRPIIDEYNRAYMLGALSSVDAVVIFDDQICAPELKAISPDIYVKGGDYYIEKLNSTERAVLLECKVEFHFIPFIENFSSSNIVERIKTAR